MNDKLQSALAILADKFGVSVEALWKILVRQAEISAWFDFVWFALATAVSATCGRLAWKCWVKLQKEPYEAWELVGALLAVVGLFAAFVAMLSLQSAVTGTLFPEGAALKSLLKAAQ